MNTQPRQHFAQSGSRADVALSSSRIEEAMNLLKPMMLNADSLSGASLFRAMSTLQKAFPDLNGHEIEALAIAVVRSLQTRRQPLD